MKYGEIGGSVLASINKYERDHNITTKSIEHVIGDENLNWTIFKSKKEDGTYTMFFAYKNKRSESNKWFWFCPSKEHITAFNKFIELYWENEAYNKVMREN